jgi:hypothetical protein
VTATLVGGSGASARAASASSPAVRSSTSRLPESSTAPSPARRDVKTLPRSCRLETPCTEENSCTVIAGTAEASVVRHRLTHLISYKLFS